MTNLAEPSAHNASKNLKGAFRVNWNRTLTCVAFLTLQQNFLQLLLLRMKVSTRCLPSGLPSASIRILLGVAPGWTFHAKWAGTFCKFVDNTKLVQKWERKQKIRTREKKPEIQRNQVWTDFAEVFPYGLLAYVINKTAKKIRKNLLWLICVQKKVPLPAGFLHQFFCVCDRDNDAGPGLHRFLHVLTILAKVICLSPPLEKISVTHTANFLKKVLFWYFVCRSKTQEKENRENKLGFSALRSGFNSARCSIAKIFSLMMHFLTCPRP